MEGKEGVIREGRTHSVVREGMAARKEGMGPVMEL